MTRTATANPDQVRAFAHPLRHRIWRELRHEGMTVSQLTNLLGVNKGNVAHHLRVLADVGLVRKDRTRTVRGGTEQYYVRTADRLVVADDEDATRAMLTSVTEEIVRSTDPLLHHRTVHLTPQQADALAQHLGRLLEDLPTGTEREARYGLLVSLYRR